MSRCYPFPPPGYEKKAPNLSADVAQPLKDKKDRPKHKDKKKKKKKKRDGDSNGDAHDKDSLRPSKQPRTVLLNDLLQSRDEKQQQQHHQQQQQQQQSTGLTVRLALPPGVAVPTRPLAPSTSTGKVDTINNNNDNDNNSRHHRSKATPVLPPPQQQQQQQQQQQLPPLYSKQEPNGTAADVPNVDLVLAPEGQQSSSRPGSSDGASPQPVMQEPNVEPEYPEPSAWCEVPDEEWLFAGWSHPKPKAEVARGQASETSEVQVWAEAVWLPSCELFALPYVAPY